MVFDFCCAKAKLLPSGCASLKLFAGANRSPFGRSLDNQSLALFRDQSGLPAPCRQAGLRQGQTKLIVTSILPRVALEYGHV